MPLLPLELTRWLRCTVSGSHWALHTHQQISQLIIKQGEAPSCLAIRQRLRLTPLRQRANSEIEYPFDLSRGDKDRKSCCLYTQPVLHLLVFDYKQDPTH